MESISLSVRELTRSVFEILKYQSDIFPGVVSSVFIVGESVGKCESV